MAKRKRNQQATPAKNQDTTSTPSKKPKIANETCRNAGLEEKPASGKPTVVEPDAKSQSTSNASKPANEEAVGAPGPAQSSSSLKRERKRKRLRELKKNDLSAGKAEDEKPMMLPGLKTATLDLPTAPVKDVLKPTAVLTDNQSTKSKARQGEKHINVDPSTLR